MKEYSAGAILYTKIDNEIHYLLIKDFHNNWGFPKGHLENDETFKQAAIREIKEEVGIDVSVNSTFITELVYKMPNGIEKHSLYYIAEFAKQVPNRQLEEVQEIKILKYDDAYDLLTFDNMKQTLKQAHKYIKSL